jgi:ketosteroid isomerase-like protein
MLNWLAVRLRRRGQLKSRIVFLACVVLPPVASAQVDSTSTRQVLATEDQRFAAMLHADTAALAYLLASDLTYTHTDGEQNTKAEFLHILATGALHYAAIEPEARDVRVDGSIAIVTGDSKMRVESGGQVQAFRIRYLAVYRRRARRWELIAWQSTRLPT